MDIANRTLLSLYVVHVLTLPLGDTSDVVNVAGRSIRGARACHLSVHQIRSQESAICIVIDISTARLRRNILSAALECAP